MLKNFITFFLLFCQFSANADFCSKSFEKDSSEADLIFIGKVNRNFDEAFYYSGYNRKYTNFDILKLYRGLDNAIFKDLKISVFNSISASGIQFLQDSIYLVFAYSIGCEENNHLKNYFTFQTSSCTSTDLLNNSKKHIERLGSNYRIIDSQIYYTQNNNETPNEYKHLVVLLIISFLVIIILLIVKFKKKI